MPCFHQVVGAIFYLTAVDRQKTCWETQCSIEDRMAHKGLCDLHFLDCKYATSSNSQSWANSTNVFTDCNANSNSVSINYGIFIQAIQNGVTKTSFSEKYFYSLWWGLQQLTFVSRYLLNAFSIFKLQKGITLRKQLLSSINLIMTCSYKFFHAACNICSRLIMVQITEMLFCIYFWCQHVWQSFGD